jgi:hypothetical protein
LKNLSLSLSHGLGPGTPRGGSGRSQEIRSEGGTKKINANVPQSATEKYALPT